MCSDCTHPPSPHLKYCVGTALGQFFKNGRPDCGRQTTWLQCHRLDLEKTSSPLSRKNILVVVVVLVREHYAGAAATALPKLRPLHLRMQHNRWCKTSSGCKSVPPLQRYKTSPLCESVLLFSGAKLQRCETVLLQRFAKGSLSDDTIYYRL